MLKQIVEPGNIIHRNTNQTNNMRERSSFQHIKTFDFYYYITKKKIEKKLQQLNKINHCPDRGSKNPFDFQTLIFNIAQK